MTTTNRIIVVQYNRNPQNPDTFSSNLVFQRQLAPSKKVIAHYLQDRGIPTTLSQGRGIEICNFKRLIFSDDDLGINMMLNCLTKTDFPLVCNENPELQTRINRVLNKRKRVYLEALRNSDTKERLVYMI